MITSRMLAGRRPNSRSRVGSTAAKAARRYDAARRAGLGRAFLAEVDAVLAFAFALAHPERYPALDDAEPAVRRALLHRVPYALAYEVVAPQSPVVLTCFDLRQEHAPDWQARRERRLT